MAMFENVSGMTSFGKGGIPDKDVRKVKAWRVICLHFLRYAQFLNVRSAVSPNFHCLPTLVICLPVYSHPWETVAQAAWRKYPNPMNPAVIGTDVVDRKVVDGVLHTHRLVSSMWGFPQWAQSVSSL
ncbi:hypothetical protein Cfor_04663 [Coptotermes formosanus]|uniref:PRELI/MSF1 domain-containing protein n=1 Tax=Coptotermes formosanus TaxID=36987 RepID=A0A6L2PB28_COPFO|nr:hypothetical protein Cfor_04663 [Coptotermes formosanus]